MTACDPCLKRSQLLAELAPWLMRGFRGLRRLPEALGLSDDELLDAVCGSKRSLIDARLDAFDGAAARTEAGRIGLATTCPHHDSYPDPLRDLSDAPRGLYLRGRVELLAEVSSQPAVAMVGSRRASSYGLEIARSLARDLASCGVVVVSGLALGIDSAAHEGALDGRGATIAVMPGGADRAYPRSKSRLHGRISEEGLVLSEMPPGFQPMKLSFPARNRIMAGLAALTVVVEGTARSGSLITAELAQSIGREVGAVPGQVTSALAAGPLVLLRDGAHLVRSAADVLDLLYGPGVVQMKAAEPPRLGAPLRRLLDGVEAGRSAQDMVDPDCRLEEVLAGLTELELLGLVRRDLSGRYLRAAA
jgi:DNA processing protein